MKNCVFCDITPCGSCKNRRLGKNIITIISVERISELGTLAVTSIVPGSLVTPMMRRYVPPKRQFLQESHGVTHQKTAFFMFAVQTSNLT
jgi:hypothetical protein